MTPGDTVEASPAELGRIVLDVLWTVEPGNRDAVLARHWQGTMLRDLSWDGVAYACRCSAREARRRYLAGLAAVRERLASLVALLDT